MDLNENRKIGLGEKLINLFNKNRIKIYILIVLILVSIFFLFFFKNQKINNNNSIAEKYIEAGIYLSTNNEEKAKKLLDKIILSENKFYSILALNTIIEKNLITDKNKILNYFQILENIKSSDESHDLILFKKALYLLKISEKKNGQAILSELINKNSKLKTLAENIIESE